MSDDDWEIRMARVKQQRGIIRKGHRNDPIQKGSSPSALPEEKPPPKKHTPMRSFSDWFKSLPKKRPVR